MVALSFFFTDLSEARCLTVPRKWLVENYHKAQAPVYNKPRIIDRVTEIPDLYKLPLQEEQSAIDDHADEEVSPPAKLKKPSRGKCIEGPYV